MITKMLICLVKLCDISTLQEARIIQAQIHKENVADKENDIKWYMGFNNIARLINSIINLVPLQYLSIRYIKL